LIITGIKNSFKKKVAGKLRLIKKPDHPESLFDFFPGVYSGRAASDVNGVNHISDTFQIKLAPDNDLFPKTDFPWAG